MAPAQHYSEAQDYFVKQTRQEIDAKPCFFDSHDWRNIVPTGGRRSSLTKEVNVETFYVRAIAAWLPERLFPNHVPCCPHCRSSRFVDVSAARWINYPKLLYGRETHRYLDTKLYPCKSCCKRFTGYNRVSMQLDATKFMGFFNFFLSSRFAVDEELHSLITSCYGQSTAMIHRMISQMTTDNYLNDHTYYLHAVRAKKVKQRPPNVLAHNK